MARRKLSDAERWQTIGMVQTVERFNVSHSVIEPCAVKTSIDGPSANAPVDNPLASQRVCSAEWLLSGEPFKESIFST
jgi:hypothetical protein